MSIKKPLLDIVQSILSDMDSDEVNSISDSVEAQQVASIVRDTFYNIISTRDVADEHKLLSLTPMTNNELPTSFVLPDNVKKVHTIQYNIQTADNPYYREICYVDPLTFLNRMNNPNTGYLTISEPSSGQPIKIQNNQPPTFFTTFDDKYVLFNSYDATVDTTLQESKLRVIGEEFPVFAISDDYVPEIAPQYFQYLINEARSVCFDVLKGGTTAKVDQAARRQKGYIQNDKYRIDRGRQWNRYGRRGL